jgi:TonB family protein
VPALPIPPQPPAPDEEATTTTSAQTVPPAAPRPISRGSALKYPRRAEEREREGTATVYVTIASGSVTGIELASENPTGFGFGDAAMNHVRQWKFAANSTGRYTVVIRFRLE